VTYAPTIGFYLAMSAPCVLAIWLVWVMVRKLRVSWRIGILVATTTLLLTPALGPATITEVLVPFGLIFAIALFWNAWGELIDLVRTFPTWYALSFPITCASAYIAFRVLLSHHCWSGRDR
jgi:hypothetical protein